MGKNYNILICPLEWGLGHAARMIPVIKVLRSLNHNIFIASGETHLNFFREEIPGLTCIKFPGFNPGYSRIFPQYLVLLLKTPLLGYHIIREHFKLKSIIQEHSIDIVISDNRFGLWNSDITTAYVTHMPRIPFPVFARFFEFTGIHLHRLIMKKYSYCFIPDLPGEQNLSGRLSHGVKLPVNVRYIGILSRFKTGQQSPTSAGNDKYTTVLLSGPEPQRGILKQKLIKLLRDKEPRTIMFEGRPAKTSEVSVTGNITFYNHLPASEMEEIIKGSYSIITRSGYTTIMELISLNCSALLIPTPGQTEQEYLASYLTGSGWFTEMSQSEINAELILNLNRHVVPEELNARSGILLEDALRELLEYHHKKCQSDKSHQES